MRKTTFNTRHHPLDDPFLKKLEKFLITFLMVLAIIVMFFYIILRSS